MIRYGWALGRSPRTVGVFLASGLAMLLLPLASVAQEVEVRAALEAHARPFTVDADGLYGAGAEWMIGRARDAQFTLIGESHHNTETPLLTEMLLAALRPAGYSAYAVEAGPESTRLLMGAVDAGGVAAGESLVEQIPFGIAFLDQREELRTAVEARALGYEVWGVDQEFVGSPRLLLGRLVELAADPADRGPIDAMIRREMSAFDRFQQSGDQSDAFVFAASQEDFEVLAAAFPEPESEGARIVRQLRATSEIYRAFREQRYFDNNATRVELIKRNFLAQMEPAANSPPCDHRALIKMGSVHAGRGRSPMHVYDLGNFAAELAFACGRESFHVLVLATGSVQADGTFASWREGAPHLAPAFDLAREDSAVVFDLMPLRPVLTGRANNTAEMEELREIALRYDALVLYPRFHPSTPIAAGPGG